jgi:hypothetical protein
MADTAQVLMGFKQIAYILELVCRRSEGLIVLLTLMIYRVLLQIPTTGHTKHTVYIYIHIYIYVYIHTHTHTDAYDFVILGTHNLPTSFYSSLFPTKTMYTYLISPT